MGPGYDGGISRQHEEFGEAIKKWSEHDLLSRILEYDAIAVSGNYPPDTVNFYNDRISALRAELVKRVSLN
jgi:hypothetical protein